MATVLSTWQSDCSPFCLCTAVAEVEQPEPPCGLIASSIKKKEKKKEEKSHEEALGANHEY